MHLTDDWHLPFNDEWGIDPSEWISAAEARAWLTQFMTPEQAETSILKRCALGLIRTHAAWLHVEGKDFSDLYVAEEFWADVEKLNPHQNWASGDFVGADPASKRWVALGVTFFREQINQICGQPSPSPPDAGGSHESQRHATRKRGGKSFVDTDAPLIEQMHKLITSGDARGPMDAALQVVHMAKGGGSVESRSKRLASRYKITRGS